MSEPMPPRYGTVASAHTGSSGSTSTGVVGHVLARDAEGWQRLVTLYTPLVYRLCRQGGQTPADVAARLGMTVPAVYQAKSRVLRRFREEFRDT
jgi:hypothetical protein